MEPMKTSAAHLLRLSLLLAASAAFFAISNTAARADEADDRIEAAAAKSYVFKTYLKDDNIDADSKNGEVTLTGTVSEESHKLLAESTVNSLPGVKVVLNQIKVKESPAERSDTWLYLKVKNTLAFHRSVSGFKTKVVLDQGVVTLSGVATSQAAKDLSTEYARDVEGVKDVKNEMTVVETTPNAAERIAEIIDDASITAQVRMTLLAHRSTFLTKATIATSDGIVSIGGKAGTAAEKELVTKLVADVNGVKSVLNNMFVAEAVK